MLSLTLLGVTSMLRAQDPSQFQTMRARKAQTKYAHDIANAEKEYRLRLISAKQDYVNALDAALALALKGGNLNEANAINAAKRTAECEIKLLTDNTAAAVVVPLAGTFQPLIEGAPIFADDKKPFGPIPEMLKGKRYLLTDVEKNGVAANTATTIYVLPSLYPAWFERGGIKKLLENRGFKQVGESFQIGPNNDRVGIFTKRLQPGERFVVPRWGVIVVD
jgi:hypothetical protein